MINHILVAHDLRDTADLALRRAAQLAKQHGARLTLLHVSPENNPSQATQDQIHQALDTSLTRFAPAGSELRLRNGRPADVILYEIQELGADLLILGSHHQRHEFFPGTTLDRIAQRCPIPLLVVAREDDTPYRRALAALDFSLCACHAFNHAYHLLSTEADLHAVHVFDSGKGSPKQLQAELDTQRALIAQLLRDETQDLPPGPTLSHAVEPGTLPRTLQDAIRNRQAELLVLGTHGRGTLANALLGDLVQHFLNKAPCDVLVVH